MTVYFQGTEKEDFVLSSISSNISNNATNYNASNVRCSLKITVEASNYYANTASFSATDFWTHFNHALANYTGNFNDYTVAWYAGATARIGLYLNTNVITLKQWNGSAWSTIATTSAFNPASGRHIYDVYIKVGTAGVGEIRVYCDGLPAVYTNSFDTTFGGAVTAFTSMRLTSGVTNTSNGDSYYSEVIIADWNTIGSRLQTIIPNGAGNYNAWTGAGYTAVDELNPGADFMTAASTNLRFSTAFSDIGALATGEIIAGVKVAGAFTKDLASPQSVDYFTRISGTDYDGTDQTAPSATNSLTNISQSWATSPATSSAWTVTELNAAEFGVRSRT